MLYDLKWPSLQSRHKYLRLILLFKIINILLLIPHHYFPAPENLIAPELIIPLNFITTNLQMTRADSHFFQELF